MTSPAPPRIVSSHQGPRSATPVPLVTETRSDTGQEVTSEQIVAPAMLSLISLSGAGGSSARCNGSVVPNFEVAAAEGVPPVRRG